MGLGRMGCMGEWGRGVYPVQELEDLPAAPAEDGVEGAFHRWKPFFYVAVCEDYFGGGVG